MVDYDRGNLVMTSGRDLGLAAWSAMVTMDTDYWAFIPGVRPLRRKYFRRSLSPIRIAKLFFAKREGLV
jgi:hypothetical protein